MTVPSATKQTALRVDRLLRSLVGVADVRPVWDAAGVLRLVHVLKSEAVRDDQLVRNVVSGLKAGLGIRVQPASVRVHATSDGFRSSAAEANGPARPPSAAEPAHEQRSGNGALTNGHHNGNHAAPNGNGNSHYTGNATNGNGHHTPPANGNGYHAPATNGNGHSNGRHEVGTNGNGGHIVRPAGGQLRSTGDKGVAGVPVPPDAGFPLKTRTAEPERESIAADLPASLERRSGPRLERIEVERHGALLRCRVTLAAGSCRYSAIAEAPDRTGADIELAASVTLDALRAGGFTTARLDGLGRVTIGSTKYLIAALRAPAAESTTAGAAPLGSSALRAAAQAVLGAVER